MQYWEIPEQGYKKMIVRQNNCPPGYERVSSYERHGYIFGKKYIHEYCRKRKQTVNYTRSKELDIGFTPIKFKYNWEKQTTQDIYDNNENEVD